MNNITIIDNDIEFSHNLMVYLDRAGYNLSFASNLDGAMILICGLKVGLVLLDPDFHDMGASIFQLSEHKAKRTILMTNNKDLIEQLQPKEYILKPFNFVQLQILIEKKYHI